MGYSELLLYLRRNERGCSRLEAEAITHNKIKRLIAQNPRLIGIKEEIVAFFFEVPFYRQRDIITEVDVVIVTDRDFYFVEVKSNFKQVKSRELSYKIRRLCDSVRHEFRISPKFLLAYKDGGTIEKRDYDVGIEDLVASC